ncbi:MAG TPA: germination protein YpeB, partial [Candidatus Avimonoglobus intestinipullorum]|nr:germination protein YpeB [Candidatus Avimonoglobus intestinipullorum]
NMDFYSFRSSDENHEITISMTKKGGHVLYYLDNRATGPEQLNFDQAIQQARQFLNAHGYTNLKESYYEKTNGVATINFAYEQGGVICYSDLIKVKVALDDGEILGLEAKGYIMNHKQRDLNTPAITEQEAKAVINKHLAVEDGKLALIPKDSLREVLCYEFTGNYNGSNFIIYINAENAREEKILMLIESEDGILTV